MGRFRVVHTNGTEVDDFYVNEQGARADVTGVKASMSTGDELIWFGRSSNVDHLSWVAYPTVNTSGPDRLTCLQHGGVLLGDSGGPVYILGTSAGIIWGSVTFGGVKRACFSNSRYIDNAMGVLIKQ
jgi:hypothetical protein